MYLPRVWPPLRGVPPKECGLLFYRVYTRRRLTAFRVYTRRLTAFRVYTGLCTGLCLGLYTGLCTGLLENHLWVVEGFEAQGVEEQPLLHQPVYVCANVTFAQTSAHLPLVECQPGAVQALLTLNRACSRTQENNLLVWEQPRSSLAPSVEQCGNSLAPGVEQCGTRVGTYCGTRSTPCMATRVHLL